MFTRSQSRAARALIVLAVLSLGGSAGCLDPYAPNVARDGYQRDTGYRFDALDPGDGNTDDLFVCLTFSGGGTRAAALAYGVLQGLRQTRLDPLPGALAERRLIDEVDMISSVSGGSFTAMSYALWHDEMFDGRFEKRFLKRNILSELFWSAFKLETWIRLPSVVLDLTNVAALHYQDEIFGETTYQDLLDRNRRPFIVINATDLARRKRFGFTQEDFDLLGSDLAQLPVSWAVAASSAFPIVFSPVRLKYFHGPALSDAVRDRLDPARVRPVDRHADWARSLLKDEQDATQSVIDEDAHQYLYLLDGGLSDNLGITHVIEAFDRGSIHERMVRGEIKRLVVIVVDAATDRPTDIESQKAAPGLFFVGLRIATTSMHNRSATLTEIVRWALLDAQPRVRQVYADCQNKLDEHCPDAPKVDVPTEALVESYVIDINFRRVRDAAKRKNFLSMITSLFLPSRDVDALVQTGRDLILQHPEFRRLVDDLAAN